MPEAARWATGCCAAVCGWPSCWARTICWFVGGDEFGIVLHDLGIDATVAGRRALAFADQIQQALCAPWPWATLAKRRSWA